MLTTACIAGGIFHRRRVNLTPASICFAAYTAAVINNAFQWAAQRPPPCKKLSRSRTSHQPVMKKHRWSLMIITYNEGGVCSSNWTLFGDELGCPRSRLHRPLKVHDEQPTDSCSTASAF